MKWSELTRSETPLDYKRILERVSLTPERLNRHLHELLEKRRTEMNNMPVNPSDNDTDEVVDMDAILEQSDDVISSEEDNDIEDDEVEDDTDEIESDLSDA